ncbi:MAG: thiamine pyrophosphate-dependent enzyme [Candidatus Aminicenantes bacterium]|jgi:pyruvate ferredoxin oxidoreductase beta subunit|nr:thiamine pyrophosphate-dependent enzyme [Candidatus Aminicenantes bacterium]MDH5385636.1 thiamine pyrophosphate-dependent enzyme [Candidatus Aminicenantes bacterium]
MAKLKDLAKMEDRLVAGHGMCLGCGIPLIFKVVLRATEDPLIIANATGCLEVCTTIFPRTSWNMTWVHSAFENAASTIAGVEAMYKSLKRQGKIPQDKTIKFLGVGGDGGTYDIGLQALSGAMERGHDIVYLCYDNNAYANTGGQRSSATPLGASATTSPAGTQSPGKLQWRKDLTKVLAAHNVPYVAQASPTRWQDLYNKAKKAFEIEGPAFLNVLCLCPTEWKYEESKGIQLAKIAVDTCVWPLYEVENGKYKINYKPKEKKSVLEWIKPQGRFRHLFKEENAWVLEEFQKKVDEEWEELNKLAAL